MQSDRWHYVKGEQQFGPVPFAVLQTLARSGDVGTGDLVWTEGMSDWVEARTVPGLFGPALTGRSASRAGRRSSGRRGAPRARPADVATRDEPSAAAAASMPGVVIFGAVLDFLAGGVAAFLALALRNGAAWLNANPEEAATRYRMLSDALNLQETASWLELMSYLCWAVVGASILAAIVILAGSGASRPIQGILSLAMAVVPALVLAEDPARYLDTSHGNVTLIAWLLLLLVLVPFGCLWGRDVNRWLDYKAGRLGGGRRRPGRRF